MRLVSSVFVALFVLFSAPVHADEAGAKQFINTLGTQALGSMKDADQTDAQKRQKLMDVVRNAVDFDWVAKFVLGRNWRSATEAQRAQYLQNYREFLLATYTSRFKEYTSVSFNVLGATPSDQGEYVVQTQIIRPSDAPISVDYRVAERGAGQYRIIDMTVEGVSLLTTQRSEFGAVANRDGVDGLIQQLGERARRETAAH